jgi:hypothetical protein
VAISLVQSKSGTNSIASQALTLDSAPTEGNTLIAGLWRRRFGSMTPGTGWVEITDGVEMNPSASQEAALYYKIVPASDTAAQTIGTWSGTPAESRITIAEFSGLDPTSPFDLSDLTKIHLQSSTTSQQLGITPTAGGEKLLIGLFHDVGSVTFTSSDSIIAQGLCDGGFSPTGMMLYRVVSPASGAYTLTGTANTGSEWGGAAASFFSAASPQTVTVGLIDRTAATFAPEIVSGQPVIFGLLNRTAVASAPTVYRTAGTNEVRHSFVPTTQDADDTSLVRPINWKQAHTDDQGHPVGPGIQYGWAPLDSGLLIPESYLPASVADPIASLFGTPDTAFEFNTSSLTGLTLMGSPDSEDANTTFAGCYFVSDNDSTLVGRYASVTPPFTVIAKIADAVLNANYKYAHLFVGVSTPGKLVSIGPVYSDGSALNGRVWSSPSDGAPAVITPTNSSMFAGSAIFPLYLAARVASSTDASYYASKDGRRWWTVGLNRNDSLTIASAGICVGAYSSAPAQAAWDFLRIWNSTKTFPAFA